MEKLPFPGSPAPRKSPVSIKHDSPHPPPQPSPAQAQSINVNLFFVIAALASAGRCWPVLGPGCFRPNVVMPRSYLLCHCAAALHGGNHLHELVIFTQNIKPR